jgi:hypothetical protein
MHSPAMGVGYFFWRRMRWPLAGVLGNIALLAIVSRLFLHAEYQPAVVFCTMMPLILACIHLLGIFTYGPTDFGASSSGFPRYMMVQPMRARSLVGWPMLYGALTVSVLWVLTFHAILLPDQPKVPFGIFFGGFFIASLAWFQVCAWISFPFPILRAMFMVLLIVALAGGGFWANISGLSGMASAAGYLLVALLAYAAGTVGLTRARRGEGQSWSLAPLLERWLTLWSRPKPFRSPLRAQLWYELRRNSLYPAALTLFIFVPMLLPLLGGRGKPLYIAGYSISARMLVGITMIALPIFLAGAFSAGVGKFDFWSNKAPTFTPFFATRAFSTINFVLTKWVAVAISTAVLWAIILAFASVFFVTSTAAERLHIFHVFGASVPAAIGRMMLVTLLLIFVTWRNQVTGFFIPFLGRAWFTNTVTMASWLHFVLLVGVGTWAVKVPEVRKTLTSLLPAIICAMALLKIVIAFVVLRILRQREIVPVSEWRKLSLIWAAGGMVLLAILCGIAGPRAMLIPAAVLLLPMVRVALAPLTLSLNRHR